MIERAETDIGLSIIVVSYNTCDVTLDCLASVYAHPPAVPFELILLDNASADGSAEAIGAAYPQVRLIAYPENTGFAKGNNIAALEAKGQRILLLNPDTLVFEKSLMSLWDFAERSPSRRIWGGRTLFGDLSLNPSSCWAQMSLWSLFCSASGLTWLFPRSGLFNPEAFGDWPRDTEREVDMVTGCFLMIDRSLWEQLGGFDPAFFMYAEEADLCIRARALGARPAVTPEAEIVHLGGVSETSAIEKVIKTTRGRVTLMRKHWSAPALWLGLTLFRFWSLSRMIGAKVVAGPRDVPDQAAGKWLAIWQRRAEWLAGYPLSR
jgi:N-acetylglucosaminyl-diphospho-decaprenol L-rhamnosyltransferase